MVSIEVKSLIKKRGQIKASVTRFQNYLESLSTTNVDKLQVKLRIDDFIKVNDKFNDVQSELELLSVNDDNEDQDERQSFENSYYNLLSKAKKLVENDQFNTGEYITRNSVSSEFNNQLRLPRLNLPFFSGNFDEWMSFFDTFQAMVHNNETLSDIQKLHYLKSSLKGEAANLLQSLEITAVNYPVAWDMLNNRYDNKRLIIQKHIKCIFDIPRISKESQTCIRSIIDTIQKHLRALKALKRPTEYWDDLLIHLLCIKLDLTTLKEWEVTVPDKECPTLASLIQFLERKCQTLEIIDKRHDFVNNRETRNKRVALHSASVSNECQFCSKDHPIGSCELFLSFPIETRIAKIKDKRLCINCFKSNHTTFHCKAKKCAKCNKKHNALLHLESSSTSSNQATSSVEVTPHSMPGTSHANLTNISQCLHTTNYDQVLLSTAVINILDNKGNWHPCRTLLDSGSQTNFITQALVNKLGLPIESTQICVTGVANSSKLVEHKVNVVIGSRLNGYRENTNCYILNRVTEKIPLLPIKTEILNIPKNITLADPNFHVPGEIDLLVGAELFWQILCVGQIRGRKGEPGFQKTKLGWVIAGKVGVGNLQRNFSCNFVTNSLDQKLERFWQIDNVRVNDNYTFEEQRCEEHFLNNVSRSNDGRFIVRLPFKSEPGQLGNSKNLALKRFLNLEKKLARTPNVKHEYDKFIKEYFELGHMKDVSNCKDLENNNNFYLPHHCVIKNESLTTKLRVVFDGSAKSTSGKSLNDILMVGPTIQETLVSILTRYRIHKYVLNADIAKMYRQVLVNPEETRFQRILWRFLPSDEIKTYELATVTYGTGPASFLATRCLQQVAIENTERYPVSSRIIMQDFYVDDLLTGADTVEGVIKIREEIGSILSNAGFQLRKWSSNNSEIVKNIQGDENLVLDFDRDECLKMLGLQWHSKYDFFKFLIQPFEVRGKKSKRVILADVAKIFDPLGFLTPVTITAKIILQELWKLKVDWDESLPIDLYSCWCNYRKSIEVLNKLTINRCIIPSTNLKTVEVHGFCDASENAYGACIYLRSEDESGAIHSHLICSKSRVAPLKAISIPRLELCGAVLLVDLMSNTLKSLSLINYETFYWTDSTIVLAWLNSESRNFNVFVANRISHIQQNTNANRDWHHVPTHDNPADLVSRGIKPLDIINNDFWWNGPKWLSSDQYAKPPINVTTISKELPDLKRPIVSLTATILTNGLEYLSSKYSSLNKLLRVVAYCVRFYKNAKIKNYKDRQGGLLSKTELTSARDHFVKIVQNLHFHAEIQALKKAQSINKSSRILSLSPFLDPNQLLRVGGRLKNAIGIQYDARHPLLLPAKHDFTNLVIRQEHLNSFHAGNNATLASVRMNYWPLNARNNVRKTINECVTCFRANPKVSHPLMGELPLVRVTPSRPFLVSGVDYCGPFIIKEGNRKSKKTRKAYVAIFVCFATRAVHIEVVSDLTSDAFIASLKRFIARRGKLSDLYSDNGTNFVGACQKFLKINHKAIAEGLETPINWHFIPSNSPHFGGIWEAAVKSAKHHLKRVAGTALLTFEEMCTLMCQIEAILNSRPLTPINNDPNDLAFLTPAHFLIGDSLLALNEPDYQDVFINRLDRWQRIQQVKQHFWRRWSTEYLAQFHQRGKWKVTKGPPLQVGQMVILRQDNISSLQWKIGRVIATHPGADGVVRAATVKTASDSEVRRAATRLCVLPIKDTNGA